MKLNLHLKQILEFKYINGHCRETAWQLKLKEIIGWIMSHHYFCPENGKPNSQSDTYYQTTMLTWVLASMWKLGQSLTKYEIKKFKRVLANVFFFFFLTVTVNWYFVLHCVKMHPRHNSKCWSALCSSVQSRKGMQWERRSLVNFLKSGSWARQRYGIASFLWNVPTVLVTTWLPLL